MRFYRTILKQLTVNITDGEHASVIDDPNGGYFLLSNKNIINGFIKHDDSDRKISKLTFDKISKRTKLQKNDVVLSTVGTIGKAAIIRDERIQFDFQRSVGIIKCDLSKLRHEYLYYYFNQKFVQKRLINVSKGAVQKCLFINDLENFLIDYPDDTNYQLNITKILITLDSKIELNNRINAELEAMAKTLYDYWFVQFDFPDANGKPYKSSGGKMVWNEELKREVPEGWEVKTLISLCDRIGDGIHGTPKYVDESDYFFINGNNLSNGFINTSKETKNVSSEEYEKYFIELNVGTILLSINGTLGSLAIYTDEKVMLGKSAAFINCKKKYRPFCYQYLKSDSIQKKFWNVATGSTIKNLSLDSIKNLLLLFPGDVLINKYFDLAMPIEDKRKNIFKENQKLTELRDWLLPMLMNGQVKVN